MKFNCKKRGHGDTETRQTFKLIESLAGTRIDKIYSGGHHTWVVKDPTNQSKNYKYKAPSPLLPFSP
jgi:hypothetical protein